MQAATLAWQNSGLTAPQAILGACGGKYYATSSDNSSVYTFVSKRGKVYAAVRSKCVLENLQGWPVWVIREPGALQVISCTKTTEATDRFVVDNVLKIFETTQPTAMA